MANNLVKSVMLKIVASDGDAQGKLDKISARAAELAKQNPDIKVKVDSAAASAKLSVLRSELKATAKDADKSKVSIKGVGAAIADLATGGLSGGIGQMNLFQKALLGVNLATGIGEPLMAGLTVAVGGLTAGLAAAGAGLGVFGLAAKGAFAQVTAANKAHKTLTGGLGELQTSLKDATGAWNRWSRAASPGVASTLGKALALVPKALRDAQPFLGPTEKALNGLIGGLGKGLSSKGFKSFIGDFAAASGPMITNLGHAIGNIAVGIGGVLRAFLPFARELSSGLDDITAKFARWGTTLSSHSGFQSLIQMFRSETPQALGVLKNLGATIKNIVSAMTGLSTFSNSKLLLNILGPVSGLLAQLSKNKSLVNFTLYALAAFSALKKVSNGIQGVSAAFSTLKSSAGIVQGVLVKLGLLTAAQTEATAATEAETAAQTELDVAMDANPIGLVIAAIAALVIGFKLLWDHSAGFRNFWKGLWHDIQHIVGDAVSWIGGHWKLILSILTGPVGAATIFIVSHWNDIIAGAKRLWSDVTGFFKKMVSGILNAVKGFGHLLYSAGRALIQGLINGLKSMAGPLGSAVSGAWGIVSKVWGLLSGSHSPSREFAKRGRWLMEGLSAGIEGSSSLPARALENTYRTLSAARASGTPGGGGGQRQVIELRISGDGSEFAQLIARTLRDHGGSPEIVTRKVVLR